MTAEIAVMNQEAVALAADSAVSGPKVFTSANKIFALSKFEPVAIMVYDSAQFLWVPWETIIKVYRRRLGGKRFDTLDEYVDDFVKFFEGADDLFPVETQERALHVTVATWMAQLLAEVDERIESAFNEAGPLQDDAIQTIVEEQISELLNFLRGQPISAGAEAGLGDTIIERHAAAIESAVKQFFGRFPFFDEIRERLNEIAVTGCLVAAVNEGSPFHSGIVIAGFGEREHFPSLKALDLELVVGDQLRYAEDGATATVAIDNPAHIRAFAQSEQVSIFMEGIDSAMRSAMVENWRARLDDLLSEVLMAAPLDGDERAELAERLSERPNEIAHQFDEELGALQYNAYIAPVIKIVAMMPKDELAAMAESLVNLTSFKRKVTAQEETVGGPIDVAVISKGDGLIWIKRKHYFKPELNHHFLTNYYRTGDQVDES